MASPPEQQAPPVQRLRVRYAKRGRARFTSHRDFSRAFERALRRAAVPMAYSSGFNPHPRISYANASPTGAATEAEYLEIGLSQVCDPALVCRALDDALPPGLDVLEVVPAGRAGLAELLEASVWRADLVTCPPGALVAGAAAFLAADEVSVSRMTKGGLRRFDARAATRRVQVVSDREVELLLIHTTPLVRPDDVVAGLRELEPALASVQPPLLLRLRQGPLCGEDVADPFAPGAEPGGVLPVASSESPPPATDTR